MRGTPPKFQNSHTFAPLEFVGQLSIFPYVGYKHHVQQLTRTCRRRRQWRGGGAENNAAAGGGSFSTRWNRLATLRTSCSHRQWWLTSPNSRGMRVSPSLRNIWGGGQQAQPTTHPPPPAPQQVGVGGMGGGQQVPRDVTYSGIDSVLKKLGHTMYDPATIDAELAVQSGVNPIEPASRRVFRDLIWPCSGGSNMYQLFTSRGCTIPSHRLPQHSAAPIVRVACRGCRNHNIF